MTNEHKNMRACCSPEMQAALDKGAAAGIPWAQLWAWAQQYGLAFVSLVQTFIDLWKQAPVNPMTGAKPTD